MSSIEHWTPAHQALAMAEGWAIFNGSHIQRDDEDDTFSDDASAVCHVIKLAEAGSSLHLLALDIHAGKVAAAEETEEDRKEREFQEARAKWKDKAGSLSDLCDAIEAGYDAGHTMYDDDMIGLAEDLSNNAAAIKAALQGS